MKIYLTFLHLMIGFSEKVKVPLNPVYNLVADKCLSCDFDNDEREEVNSTCDFVSRILSEHNSNDSELAQEIHDNRAELKENKLAEKFVSKNVIDLRLLKNFSVFKRT